MQQSTCIYSWINRKLSESFPKKIVKKKHANTNFWFQHCTVRYDTYFYYLLLTNMKLNFRNFVETLHFQKKLYVIAKCILVVNIQNIVKKLIISNWLKILIFSRYKYVLLVYNENLFHDLFLHILVSIRIGIWQIRWKHRHQTTVKVLQQRINLVTVLWSQIHKI